MIRFCWIHVSFNFVVVESSSLGRAVGLDLHSLLWNDLFSCKTNWNYMNQLKLLSVRCRFRFKLAIVSVKWMSLKCWLHFQTAIVNLESASTKLLSAKAWFRSGVQVTFVPSTKMTSGSPLLSSFKLPFQLLRDCWLLPNILSPICRFGMELPLKGLSQSVPLKFCVFQQTLIRGEVPRYKQ